MEHLHPLIELDNGLALRRFTGAADLPEFCRVIEESLDHLLPWMPWAGGHSEATAGEWLAGRAEQWELGREFSYAITLDGRITGACGLFRRADAPDNGREIGYWLHPAATGRGVATRSAAALVDQAFQLPGVDYVEVVHDTANQAPARAARTRCGVSPGRPSDPAASRTRPLVGPGR